jgi:excisionase family DNA binding protein
MDTITVTQAAKMLGVTPTLIRYYIQRGLFPGAEKVRGTRWKIPKAEVELFDGTDVSGSFSRKKKAPFCKEMKLGDKWCCLMFGGAILAQFFSKESAGKLSDQVNEAAELWAKGTK